MISTILRKLAPHCEALRENLLVEHQRRLPEEVLAKHGGILQEKRRRKLRERVPRSWQTLLRSKLLEEVVPQGKRSAPLRVCLWFLSWCLFQFRAEGVSTVLFSTVQSYCCSI